MARSYARRGEIFPRFPPVGAIPATAEAEVGNFLSVGPNNFNRLSLSSIGLRVEQKWACGLSMKRGM